MMGKPSEMMKLPEPKKLVGVMISKTLGVVVCPEPKGMGVVTIGNLEMDKLPVARSQEVG